MKNSEIHKGLLNENVRNFLANELRDFYDNEVKNKKEQIPNMENAFDWVIKDAEAIIEFNKRRIEYLIARKGLYSIIKKYGWEEHDVSDYISLDTGYDLCLAFIGTEEEYNQLMKKLKEK